jgi:hypothetical protein
LRLVFTFPVRLAPAFTLDRALPREAAPAPLPRWAKACDPVDVNASTMTSGCTMVFVILTS